MSGNRLLKLLFLALPLLMAGITGWYLYRPHGLQSGAMDALILKEGPSGALVTGLHLVQFDGQRTRWTLDAPNAEKISDSLIGIQKPLLTLYNEQGEAVRVTAGRGSVDPDSRMMTFEDRVRVNDEKLNLSTELLRFDPNRKMLYTDEEFQLEGTEMRLTGVGFTLFQETRTATVSSRVSLWYANSLSEMD